jgi:hypothetical protein
VRFGDYVAARKPMRVLELPSDVFAAGADASVRPKRVGLVTISQEAIQRGRATAANEAWVLHPNVNDVAQREQSFRESYACHLLAAAITDPDDATRPPEAWEAAPADVMRMAVTDQGLRWLIAEVEQLHVDSSPLSEEADALDLECLSAVMLGALPRTPSHIDARVRRLLRHCLDLVSPYLPEEDPAT